MKKKLVTLISTLMPGLFTSFAYRQMSTPAFYGMSSEAQEVLNESQQEDYVFENFTIRLYTWLGGPKEVFLVHGWEGHGGHFAHLVPKLLEKGYTVRAFDGPSHGASSTGSTNLMQFTRLTGELMAKFQVTSVVSHSFGNVAVVMALASRDDIHLHSYILLASPDSFQERVDYIFHQQGISPKVKERLLSVFEKEIGLPVGQMRVSAYIGSLDSVKGLMIHGKEDRVVPVEQARRIHEAWKGSTLMEIEQTGHFNILKKTEVLDQLISFLG